MKAEKSIEEVLQEEFLRERAAVLSKAAEKLTKILHQLAHIEETIKKDSKIVHCLPLQEDACGPLDIEVLEKREFMQEKINQNIDRFNIIREQAKTQYYYLIVTREALGLRKHHWVEEFYSIPPKKKHIKDN